MNLLGKRAGYVSVAVDNGTSGLELVRRLNEEGIELFSVFELMQDFEEGDRP